MSFWPYLYRRPRKNLNNIYSHISVRIWIDSSWDREKAMLRVTEIIMRDEILTQFILNCSEWQTKIVISREAKKVAHHCHPEEWLKITTWASHLAHFHISIKNAVHSFSRTKHKWPNLTLAPSKHPHGTQKCLFNAASFRTWHDSQSFVAQDLDFITNIKLSAYPCIP